MSKREEKKYSHKAEEKKIRKMMRRLDKLRTAKWNLGWVELDKPEPWGWEKVLVLRDDIAKRKDAKFFKELLELVNHKVVNNNKSFIVRNYSTGKKAEVFVEPKTFDEKDLEKIPEKFRSYFTLEAAETRHWGSFYRKYYQWTLNKPYLFKEKIQKHYVTRKQLHDPDLESQIDEIEHYVYSNGLWSKWYHMLGERSSSSYERASRRTLDKGKRKQNKIKLWDEIND